ncbi:PTS glucose transporter subunit IIA [Bacillus australimaris]|uniref:PTS glucose transporter subunit IIA n=1 Tax=Bacillus australimaris TaxID=1326968 RepID=UPI000AF08998|nr:PTS glucose transporter subunit IIA [Bacillus australimaris]
MNNEETITAHLAGKVLPLSEVPDAVFSSGMMDKGFAMGLRSEFGVELLVDDI